MPNPNNPFNAPQMPQAPRPPRPQAAQGDEFTLKPMKPGTNPRSGLTQQQESDWINQPGPAQIPFRPGMGNNKPDMQFQAWNDVKGAIGNIGGLKGQAINQTISNAIKSGDAGRVGQAISRLGLKGIDPNDVIGHYNNRVGAFNKSSQGKAAASNFRNNQLANMSYYDYHQNVVHPHLRRKFANMRAAGLTTPHVASPGTIHSRNKGRAAFRPVGEPDSEGNQRYREVKPFRVWKKDIYGNPYLD